MLARQCNLGNMPNQEEDIHELIPKEFEPEVKMPMYHSKFSMCVRKEVQQRKHCHKTMGYAQVVLQPPDDFLKKKTRIVRRPFVDKTKPAFEKKPPLPARCKAGREMRSEKNFKKDNIIHANKLKPKEPVPAFNDTTLGDKQKLDQSGLLPKYIFRKNYGQTPKYLLVRQKVKYDQQKAIAERESKKKPPLRYISDLERQELLDGLKKNWQELQKEFQLLPMVTDTVPKIKRKTKLEAQLRALEKDIELVERNPIMYVDGHNNVVRNDVYEE